jgi:uncharacterized protein (DUF427 family)
MFSGRPVPAPAGPGQESVWDYPRPPRLEAVPQRLRIVFDGLTLADTQRGWRVLETSHPPTYYLPQEDIAPGCLVPAGQGSLCEWKGRAAYFDVAGPRRRAARAAWTYPKPTEAFAAIAGHVAFYAGAMEGYYVGDERVTPQPGGFYGGWITKGIVGPFKGEPGTMGW